MTLKRGLFGVAVAASALNLLAVGYAAVMAEPMHAIVHSAIALVFGIVAAQLRKSSHKPALADPRMNLLEDHISDLERELEEKKRGLDFAEQLLAQRPAPPKVDPLRYAPKQPDETGLRHDLEDEEPR